MIKTLRITSLVLAAVTAGAVVLFAVWGFKGNSDIETLLAQDGAIDQAKRQTQTAPKNEETISPLVTQARRFALRIDPPPPPPPPRPVATAQEPVRQPRPVEPVRPPVVTPPQVTGRYSLVATARYEDFPERSLALFKPLVGPAKWHRQGEILGHLEIHEIRDGSVVLYQGGTMNSELFVPKPTPRGKPLLKSEADAATAAAGQPSATSTFGAGTAVGQDVAAGSDDEVTGGTIRPPRGVSRTAPTQTVDVAGRIRRVTTAPPAPPPREPTPQEQKVSIQQSISSIEDIMSRSDVHVSEDEQKKEQEAWMQLLQVLQQEKESLEATSETTNAAPSQSEPTQKEDSEQ